MGRIALRFQHVRVQEKGYGILADASFLLPAAQTLAVVGLNDSGLRCILGILQGVLPAYGGTIAVEGKPVALSNTEAARKAGVYCIGAKSLLIPTLTIAENLLVLDRGPASGRFYNARAAARQAECFLKQFSMDVNANAYPEELTSFERQEVELCKAIGSGASILCYAPPAGGTDSQNEMMAARVRALNATGISVLLLLNDYVGPLCACAERLVAVRSGVSSTTLYRDADGRYDAGTVRYLMTGRAEQGAGEGHRRSAMAGDAVLRVFSRAGSELLSLAPGEIGGLYLPADTAMGGGAETTYTIRVHGEALELGAPGACIARRTAYIQEAGEMVFPNLSVAENIAFLAQAQWGRRHILHRRVIRYIGRQVVEALPSLHALLPLLDRADCYGLPIQAQADILFARWLAIGPDCVVVRGPFGWWDPRDRERHRQLLVQLAAQGKTILLLSGHEGFLRENCGPVATP